MVLHRQVPRQPGDLAHDAVHRTVTMSSLPQQAESSTIWVTNDLSLNVMWADIPLITDGAAVDVQKQDDTTSMKWNLVKP